MKYLIPLFIFLFSSSHSVLAFSANYLVKISSDHHPFLSSNYDKELIIDRPIKIYKTNSVPLFIQDGDFIVEENIETFLLSDNNPQDTLYELQWALDNRGDNEPRRGGGRIPIPGVVGSDLSVLNIWNEVNSLKTIVVAVVDTGIDYQHEDLKNSIWINESEIPGNGIDDDGNGFIDDVMGYDFSNQDADPMDDYKHGTHVAGIISAEHNTLGIAGLSKNSKLMAVKHMDHKGRGNLEQAIKAIGYAIDNGAKVINNSWGMLKYSKILEDLMIFANEKGIIFVSAAGNNYKNLDESPLYPAAYKTDNNITVAAMSPENRMTAFSCYGPTTVHIAAPGRNIMSTVPANKYEVLSGTSMAAPYVAAAVSIYLGKYENSTPLEIRDKIISTSTYMDHFKGRTVSEGRLNVENFIK